MFDTLHEDAGPSLAEKSAKQLDFHHDQQDRPIKNVAEIPAVEEYERSSSRRMGFVTENLGFQAIPLGHANINKLLVSRKRGKKSFNLLVYV